MRRLISVAPVILALALSGCGERPAETKPPVRSVPVTSAIAEARTVETLEFSLGRIEAPASALLAAEVEGRVGEVLADEGERVAVGRLLAVLDDRTHRNRLDAGRAALARTDVQYANQAQTVERMRELVGRRLVSQAQFDDSVAQRDALDAQRRELLAQIADAEYALARSRVLSPLSGVVDRRHVAVGDYVKSGTPLFEIVSDEALRARLPFPETVAHRLREGLTVRLSPVARPEEAVEAHITELRPSVGPGSGAVEAIAAILNPGGWTAGGSVRAEVVIERRENAVTVPEGALVRRPAGEVVYVIEGETAREARVRTGVRREGLIEIIEGIEAGVPVVVGGAGFLTDGARIAIRGTPGS